MSRLLPSNATTAAISVYVYIESCGIAPLLGHRVVARWRTHTPRSAWFPCYREAIALKPAADYSSPAVLGIHLLPPDLSVYVYCTLGVSSPRFGLFYSIMESSVTENLVVAVEHLESDNTTLSIWIDALCINQKDNKGKSVQVEQMGTISR